MNEATQEKSSTYSKESPLVTKLLENIVLNKKGSQKDTRHFNICLKDSGLKYIPGDSLYVFAENDPEMVNQLLDLLELDQDRETEKERFQIEVNITRASNKMFKMIEAKAENLDAKEMAEKFTGYSLPAIIAELKKENTELKIGSNELAENSSKLNPRAYSIASSQSAHPDEVHLCIARVDEEINGQKILGVCSNFLSHRIELNQEKLRIYVHTNERFRLPPNSETDIIMVGPGTGIAPFRAYIEERNYQRDQGQKVGKDWLFFGDQRQAFDYLYDEELEAAKEKYGLNIDLAFSRDQEHKVYVQNRMEENSDKIFEWLENGAYFYVCGDARRMAKDVDAALHKIIEDHGKDAVAYVKDLKDTKRYCRDVY